MIRDTVIQGTDYGRAGLFTLPSTLGTWAVEAKVFYPDRTLVQTLSASIMALSQPDADGHTHGVSIAAIPAQTALWPLTKLHCGLKFTASGGTVFESSLYEIAVRPGTP